jgi:hypothetical protein
VTPANDFGVPIPAFVWSVFGGGLFGYALLYFTITLWHAVKVHFYAKKLWIKIVTDEGLSAPEGYDSAEQSLLITGTEFLGIVRERNRAAPQPYDVWIYLLPGGEGYAAVLFAFQKPFMMTFTTMFPDQSMVVTRYPAGEHITTPRFVSRFARGSIEAAWESHRKQVEAWKGVKGKPVVLRSMQEVVDMDEVYVRHYLSRETSRARRLNFSEAALYLALALTSLGTLIASSLVAWEGMAVFIVLEIGAGLLLWWGHRRIRAAFAMPPGAVDAVA